MSLAKSNRVHRRREIKLKKGCKLEIKQSLLNKITMAHHFVTRNTEWSGVLIYSTKEGSVNDPESWVIQAEDMALMDIGNAAYTEYEFDPSDEYSFEIYSEALVEGKKLGHKVLVTIM